MIYNQHSNDVKIILIGLGFAEIFQVKVKNYTLNASAVATKAVRWKSENRESNKPI